jgi:hypothetical protein
MKRLEVETTEPVSAGAPRPGDVAFWVRRSVVAALVLSLGWVFTIHPVPIYDGVRGTG